MENLGKNSCILLLRKMKEENRVEVLPPNNPPEPADSLNKQEQLYAACLQQAGCTRDSSRQFPSILLAMLGGGQRAASENELWDQRGCEFV